MSLLIIPATLIATAVPPDMFGGNSLFHLDDINPQFTQNVAAFNLSHIRWPGGSITENWFDPATPDVPLMVPRRDTMNLSHDSVLTFTEIMNFSKSTGRPVDIVVPTIHILKTNSAGIQFIDEKAVADIQEFVRQALLPGGKYPDARVASIEIGNEYWSAMTAKEYGRVANVLVKAVDRGIKASGSSYRPKILVQIGDAWGPDFDAGGEYHGKGLSWGQILDQANKDIVAQIDAASKKLISGTVDHFYTSHKGGVGLVDSDGGWAIKKRREAWEKAGIKADTHLTEWNVKMDGLKQSDHPVFAMGGGLVETFEIALRGGAKSAHIWPVNQSTPNDLAGRADGGPGHLSSGGATFKLLSDNVRGLSPQNLTTESDRSVEKSLYRDALTSVLFLTPVRQGINTKVDLSAITPPRPGGEMFLKVTQQRVTRDETQDAFVGKGAGAKIVLDKEDNGQSISAWPVIAGPYETVMIKVQWLTPPVLAAAAPNFNGTQGPDKIVGNDSSQTIRALGGNDVVHANGGHDVVYGGEGDDKIYAGIGNDTVHGEGGNDYIESGNGNDVITGGNGNDVLHGQNHNDHLDGGHDNDKLYGGAMNDTLLGGTGNDLLHGGAGNDHLVAGHGNDILYGEGDNDVLYFGNASYGSQRDIGGAGEDQATGGAGADVFVFGGTSGWTGILDFEDNVDKIRFVQPGVHSIKDLKLTNVRDSAGRKAVRIDYKDAVGGGTIRVSAKGKDLTTAQITATDFIFAPLPKK